MTKINNYGFIPLPLQESYVWDMYNHITELGLLPSGLADCFHPQEVGPEGAAEESQASSIPS